MNTAGSAAPRRLGWPRRIGWILLRLALALAALGFIAWGSLALTLDGPGRIGAAVYVLASVALVLFVRPRRRGRLLCGVLSALVLVWWLSIEPKNERDWLPDVRELPTLRVDGERLTALNLRNFEYRTDADFTPRWEERTFDLSRITGLDLVVCDWGEKLIVHTMLSWEFEDGEHLAVSIETRKEVGEGYSAVRGFFRQFELYYVVGDERDLIGVRTDVRGERVRLYRLAMSPENARALLLSYCARINDLAVNPAWYNALSHNCTTSIRLHAIELGVEQPWNWRVLVNGHGEELLYMRNQVNTSLPFEELRTRSDVTEAAQGAGTGPDFSARIRASIPERPSAQ